jgi:hypothetical protein
VSVSITPITGPPPPLVVTVTVSGADFFTFVAEAASATLL